MAGAGKAAVESSGIRTLRADVRRRRASARQRGRSRFTAVLAAALALPLATTPAAAQYLTRPQIPWRTITTARFDIHFPAEMEEWTRVVARQMEAVADQVNAVVGNEPAARVTVIVEDPSNVANGFALPFLEGPVIFLWPTPPAPSPTFGTHRGWGEVLAIHEYGHIAHLTFASRNPRERSLWRFMPVQLSPVTRKSPAWVIEGYATLIEGQLTGSGRPFSSGRAAVIRQWALEGRLPTYAQLNGSGAFLGGNMRYLMGSAFLEWLQQRRGDSSLVHLWRRMSARQDRPFDAAFAGVFGAPAPDLYGAFTVDVMERSLQVRTRLRDAGLAEGELVQRLSGGTGEPALSPDGSRIAVVVRSLNGPSRLVVWSSQEEPDTAIQRARARMLRLDSLDVAPFDSFPRGRRALATLHPVRGRSHEHPRWMPDGIHVLVTRDEPAPNGVTRPDVFRWNTRSGDVQRLTRGAGIRQVDPAPDGGEGAGVRCHAGICSVVLVNLDTGAWRDLVRGTPERVWHRPRFSPDGGSIAVSYQEAGRWGVAVVARATGEVRFLADREASRHSPAFTPAGNELVVVSDRGGIPNLELLPLDGTPPRPLTRVVGAVLAPEVSRADSSVWFLSLRSGGYDVRRLRGTGNALGSVVAIQGALAPVAPPVAVVAGTFAGARDSARVTDYGLGPRRWRILPGGTAGPDGHATTIMVANIDPISRLSVVTQGTWGSRGSWRGVSSSALLRRLSAGLEGSLWYVEHEPSRARDHLAPATSDLRYAGAGVSARWAGEGSSTAWALRAGGHAGTVTSAGLDGASRGGAWLDARGRQSVSSGTFTFTGLAGAFVEGGTTDGASWQRIIASGTLAAGTSRYSVRGDWMRGSVSRAGTSSSGRAVEQFVIGGSPNPLIDPNFMAQRVSLPAVPAGFVVGSAVQSFRASILGLQWEPYFTWVTAGDPLHHYRRIAGLERTFAIQSLGFARLPAIRARGGAAWSIDEPFRHRLRAYASVVYLP